MPTIVTNGTYTRPDRVRRRAAYSKSGYDGRFYVVKIHRDLEEPENPFNRLVEIADDAMRMLDTNFHMSIKDPSDLSKGGTVIHLFELKDNLSCTRIQFLFWAKVSLPGPVQILYGTYDYVNTYELYK